MTNTNDNNETVISVEQGTNITVENANGPEPIRILIVNSHTGDVRNREVPAGTTISEVVGETSADGDDYGEVRRNGDPADMDTPLETGDKISITPANPQGN